MNHPLNFPTPYEDYFTSNVDFNPKSVIMRVTTGLRSTGRVLYSLEAKNRVRRLIGDVRPDIAHLHMIDHQLSPSFLSVLKKENIPIVQTIHTYKHVCPSYRLYLMKSGEICEKCIGGDFYHAVTEKCHKDSMFASSIVMAEMYLHKWLKLYKNSIDSVCTRVDRDIERRSR